MPQRKAARVLPEPVGAQISALEPPAIASQPPAWAGVGASKEDSNQRLTGALKGANGSGFARAFGRVLNPPILRAAERAYGRPPAKRVKANQEGFGTKPSSKRPEPSQKLQAPFRSSTENQ